MPMCSSEDPWQSEIGVVLVPIPLGVQGLRVNAVSGCSHAACSAFFYFLLFYLKRIIFFLHVSQAAPCGQSS